VSGRLLVSRYILASIFCHRLFFVFPCFSPLCGAAKSQVKYIFFGSQRQHTKPKCNNFLKAAFPHPVCLGFSPRLSKLLNSATMLFLQAAPKVTKIHKDTAQRPEPPKPPTKTTHLHPKKKNPPKGRYISHGHVSRTAK